MNKNLVLLLVSGLFFALVWLNWQPTKAKPAAAAAEKQVSVKTAPLPVGLETLPLEEEGQPKHYRPKPVSEAVRRKVDDFIRRHKDATPEQLMKSEEMVSISERFGRMMDTPEFQTEVEKRMEAIVATRGKAPGMLSIGSGKLDEPEGRAWLEAMFSEDADMLKEYILNKLDGAVFEFAFDPSLKTTESGVTVQERPGPKPNGNKLPD